MTGAGKTSAPVTAKPASDSAAAIEAGVREMVLVTKASGSPALRCRMVIRLGVLARHAHGRQSIPVWQATSTATRCGPPGQRVRPASWRGPFRAAVPLAGLVAA
jgi:hypothetical protein